MKPSLISPLLLLLPFVASAQQTKILTAEKHNEYGLVYSLPQTAVNVRVTAVCETRHAGPYYQYAKKYLGTDRVITDDVQIWSISDVAISAYGVASEGEQYLMQLKPGALTSITVAPDGMLLAINTPVSLPPASPLPADTNSDPGPGVKDYLKFVDQDFTASQSTAKQAEMLASSLMDVRDAYLSLTRGTADNMPVDGRQLELMLNSLQEQEKALTRAFTGTTETRTVTRDFSFIPDSDGREVLFRLSDFAGFVDKDDYSGDPVYINTEILSAGQIPVDANGVEKKLPKDAVIYGIPGEARFTISFSGDNLATRDLRIAQFGTTFGLAPSLFTDKKEPSCAIFDPTTGALVEISTLPN